MVCRLPYGVDDDFNMVLRIGWDKTNYQIVYTVHVHCIADNFHSFCLSLSVYKWESMWVFM